MQEAGSIYSGCPRHARNIRPNILYAKLFNYLRSSPFSPRSSPFSPYENVAIAFDMGVQGTPISPLFSPASTTLTFDGDPEGDNPTRGYRRKAALRVWPLFTRNPAGF